MRIRKLGIWIYMLTKRLLHKGTFLLLLLLIPLLVAGFRIATKQESGMLRIALCRESESDRRAESIMQRLAERQGVLLFVVTDTVEEAYRCVETGKADAAWILLEDMQKRIERYATARDFSVKLVKIVEREDNVALQLAREKLYGAMYADLSYAIYESYVRNELLPDMRLSPEMLREAYEYGFVDDKIYEGNMNSPSPSMGPLQEADYLTFPLRGMLALLILLCGLAAVMYYLQDEQQKMFAWVAISKRKKYFYAYEFTAMGVATLAVLPAYALAGIWTDLWTELSRMVIYILACGAFCGMIRTVNRSLQRVGAVIPILLLLMFAVCPVFFSPKQTKWISLLLPPTYYIQGLFNPYYFRLSIVYCGVLYLLDITFHKIFRNHLSES